MIQFTLYCCSFYLKTMIQFTLYNDHVGNPTLSFSIILQLYGLGEIYLGLLPIRNLNQWITTILSLYCLNLGNLFSITIFMMLPLLFSDIDLFEIYGMEAPHISVHNMDRQHRQARDLDMLILESVLVFQEYLLLLFALWLYPST